MKCLSWTPCSGKSFLYTAVKKRITLPLHKVPRQVMVRTSGCTLCVLDMTLVAVQGIASHEKQSWSFFLNSCRCAFLFVSQLCELSTECHSIPASPPWHWNAAKILMEVLTHHNFNSRQWISLLSKFHDRKCSQLGGMCFLVVTTFLFHTKPSLLTIYWEDLEKPKVTEEPSFCKDGAVKLHHSGRL